jgi:phage terminase small subunit
MINNSAVTVDSVAWQLIARMCLVCSAQYRMAKTQDKKHGLTDLELRFCNEYAHDFNGTQAVIRVGMRYASINSAAQRASELLRKPKIRAYLCELLQLDNVVVLNEVTRIALAQITDVCHFNADGIRIKTSDELSDRARSAIKSVKVTERYDEAGGRSVTTEVRMYDKLSALDKLMRKLRLYPSTEPILGAINLLAAEGYLPPEQVEIILNGLNDLKTNLRTSQSRNATAETT